MATKTTARKISISCNHIWAGDGNIRDGVIEDCAAILGGSQDEADRIYEAIEDAIESGKDSLVDGDDTYTWTIEAASTKAIYTVRTDSFLYDDFEAESLDAAIAEAFSGEIAGITDEVTLREKFAKYVDDGGWCWIECDDERVLEIGECE